MVTKQEFINGAALDQQPGPEAQKNTIPAMTSFLTSATQAEERKHAKYDRMCAATGSILSPLALETTGGHGASTKSVYLLFTNQMRDDGLPADVLVGMLKKDISFALRRGTIAKVTTHQALDATLATPAQRAAEDEFLRALNRQATSRRAGIARQPSYLKKLL